MAIKKTNLILNFKVIFCKKNTVRVTLFFLDINNPNIYNLCLGYFYIYIFDSFNNTYIQKDMTTSSSLVRWGWVAWHGIHTITITEDNVFHVEAAIKVVRDVGLFVGLRLRLRLLFLTTTET